MFHKDRVQVRNPITERMVLINTATGSIIGHKSDGKSYRNVMTAEERKKLCAEESIPIDDVKISIDPKYAKAHIVCDCGHYARDHYLKEGCCNKCGCTWYYPNDKWIRKQKRIARKNMIPPHYGTPAYELEKSMIEADNNAGK